jgi:hypothetical protein
VARQLHLHRGVLPVHYFYERNDDWMKDVENRIQVPILSKVTNIGLQIFVTCTVYILVAFYLYFPVKTSFYHSFESIVLNDTCKKT